MEDRPKLQSDTQEAVQKVRLIENPLPLPKKHVKKTMDYKIDVAAGQMKYDIEVTESDDFDLQ